MSQERAHKPKDINEDIFSIETTEKKQPITTGNNNPWGDEIGKKPNVNATVLSKY